MTPARRSLVEIRAAGHWPGALEGRMNPLMIMMGALICFSCVLLVVLRTLLGDVEHTFERHIPIVYPSSSSSNLGHVMIVAAQKGEQLQTLRAAASPKTAQN